MADPLDAFPDVTDESDRDLVARHQRAVREFPDLSVADLVYDYRTQFHEDPLVERDESAFYLSVRSHVWTEFADWMDLSDDELAQLKAAHARQFEASVGRSADYDALVLAKDE
ncbi:hypothetical protein [Halorussus amylolyticus]|uniref:hypothetical protein n=1 Tax=Halorussus amylolyticus TaxID=1126242 RepID=UPI00104F723E|nr:hypothetical protein [Halorussus amylolyticus]